MNVREIADHYGGITAMAKALKVTRPTVYAWLANEEVPVPYMALVELQTDGLFKLDRRRIRHG